MKEEIKKFKEKHETHQMKVTSFNAFLSAMTDGENESNEALKMVDLRFEKNLWRGVFKHICSSTNERKYWYSNRKIQNKEN